MWSRLTWGGKTARDIRFVYVRRDSPHNFRWVNVDVSDHFVHVRGASEHNLKDVDVDIPRDAMVVFTGVSGSGKSSLAFGTLYAEAQRRYFESVAPYARRLLHQVGAPHVREITGLPPAVALQQRHGAPSSRSTVGTITTLSNLLRMLYSRAGTYSLGAPRLEAESFSPNTAAGACSKCHGLGVVHDVTEDLLVPDASLSIRDGAIAAWPGAWQGANLRSIVSGLEIDIDTPWHKLKKKDRDWLLYTDEQPSFDRHFAVNAKASWLLIREFGLRFKGVPGRGRIIALTSDATVGNVPYGASKGALDRITLAAAHEFADLGITANVINPGPTQTGWMTPELEVQIIRDTPLSRLGVPEDTANLVAFLCSPEGGWVNGQLLHSNGGLGLG